MIEPSFLALLVRRELVDQLYGFAHFKGHSRPADPAIASRVETGKISPFRKKKNIQCKTLRLELQNETNFHLFITILTQK